jgi:hypothetical protein
MATINSNLKVIDLDLMNETFELAGDDELFRIGGRSNKPIRGEKIFVYLPDGSKDEYITRRIIYAMNNNVEIFNPLMLNDSGNYIPVPNTIRALVRLNFGDRIFKDSKTNRGYVAKILNPDGTRPSKTFKTYNEAVKYHRDRTEQIWGDELRKYDIHKKYFDGYSENIETEPMPDIVPRPMPEGYRVKRWNEAEIASLRIMYNRGDKLQAIADRLGRNYGQVQSRIYKMNHNGEM